MELELSDERIVDTKGLNVPGQQSLQIRLESHGNSLDREVDNGDISYELEYCNDVVLCCVAVFSVQARISNSYFFFTHSRF